ncbi:MAG TPA: DUF6056 family protein [Chloroflexota bacterium]|nr:DUF6056 family protein [Chloroflexota bacterium]
MPTGRSPLLPTRRVGLGALGLSLAVVIAAYAYRGWFARYTADDYCTAGLQRAAGFVGAQVDWYQNWSGRFSYYFVVGLFELVGPAIVQVLPAVALLALIAAGGWALRPVAVRQRWPVPTLTATLVSTAVALICVQGAPNVDQSLFWQTGMLTYVLPLVLLTVSIGWLARVWAADAVSRWALLGNGVLLLVTAGLSETSLGVQLTLLVFAVAFALLVRPVRATAVSTFLVVGLVASLIGAVLVVIAPGNYLHELRVTGRVHSVSELPDAFRAGIDFVGLFARAVQFRARVGVVLALGLSIWLGLHGARVNRAASTGQAWLGRVGLGLGIVVCGWVLLLAAIVPGYFAQQWDVPERAQIVPVWVAALGLCGVGYLLGEALGQAARRRSQLDRVLAAPAWNAVLVALAVVSLLALPTALAQVPVDTAYAAEWDALDATIRERALSGDQVTVERTLPPHFGFEFLTSDPTYYPNPCVAQFYGLTSIRVSPAQS